MVALPWSSEPQGRTRVWADTAARIRRMRRCAVRSATHRLATIAWICVALFLAVDIVWLALSPLRFAPANWTILAALATAAALLKAVVVLSPAAPHRRRTVLGRIVHTSQRLACRSFLLLLIVASFLVFTYLATAAALPLQDELLAAIDRKLGFDWPAFLTATNDNAHLAAVLSACYHSTGALLLAIVVWLCVSRQQRRLAELLAALSLTFVGLAIGMIVVPTAGAFAFFGPAAPMFASFAEPEAMWPFYGAFAALRDGSLTMIDFIYAEGIVGFPSFHAALGVVTTWSLRDSRRLLPPVLALNTIMMVAILPVGGHHLIELLAGVCTGMAAIALTAVMARSTDDGGR